MLLKLQEVRKLPTLVYFSKGHHWPWLSPRGCLGVSPNIITRFWEVLG